MKKLILFFTIVILMAGINAPVWAGESDEYFKNRMKADLQKIEALTEEGLKQIRAEQRWNDFWSHDSMYASWSHVWFSVWGYKSFEAATAVESKAGGWWGEEITLRCRLQKISDECVRETDKELLNK